METSCWHCHILHWEPTFTWTRTSVQLNWKQNLRTASLKDMVLINNWLRAWDGCLWFVWWSLQLHLQEVRNYIVNHQHYVMTFIAGIGPLAWTLNAELYPAESKKLSASIAFTVCWLFAFMTTQFTTQLESAINTSGLFYFFGSACLICKLQSLLT